MNGRGRLDVMCFFGEVVLAAEIFVIWEVEK